MPQQLSATVTAYTFQELSEEAQDRLIEEEREFRNSDGFESYLITESFERDLGVMFDHHDLKVHWSLSYCQGDGVEFVGRVSLSDFPTKDNDCMQWEHIKDAVVTRERLIEMAPLVDELDPEWTQLEARLTSINSHYSHWNSFQTELLGVEELECILQESIDMFDRSWGQEDSGESDDMRSELEKQLHSEIDALEEAVSEMFRDLSRAFERMGYDEIEWITGEEVAREYLADQDYLYDEEGKRIPTAFLKSA